MVMKAVLDKLELAFDAFGGFIGWFLGDFDGFLYALVVFVVMDYFTVVLVAGVKKELSSEVRLEGIAKKVCIFVLVGISNIVDTQIIHDGAVVRTTVIFFYLANEGISILENSASIELPVPYKLKAMLRQLEEEEYPKGKEAMADLLAKTSGEVKPVKDSSEGTADEEEGNA